MSITECQDGVEYYDTVNDGLGPCYAPPGHPDRDKYLRHLYAPIKPKNIQKSQKPKNTKNTKKPTPKSNAPKKYQHGKIRQCLVKTMESSEEIINTTKPIDPFEALHNHLELSERQCVYCTTVCDKLDLDEVWPSTIVGRPGRINPLNCVNACPSCNKSKNNKIDNKFIQWVKAGGIISKPNKIPEVNREKIIFWYNLYKDKLYSTDPGIIQKIRIKKESIEEDHNSTAPRAAA